jgi:hypothetical protein
MVIATTTKTVSLRGKTRQSVLPKEGAANKNIGGAE